MAVKSGFGRLQVALAGIFSALGAISGTAYYISLRVSPPSLRTYLDFYTFTPWELGVPYEKVEFRSSDGLRLVGWWLPRPETNAVIVGSHGHKLDAKTSCSELAAIAGGPVTMSCCSTIEGAVSLMPGRKRSLAVKSMISWPHYSMCGSECQKQRLASSGIQWAPQ
ncbi:MAG: hypothetical protein KatS3mg056_2919 [Chloroflexus sp.]|nr:MAG: hypothetical protein KatS3mg056_2919 [Chloroflexus sp.]